MAIQALYTAATGMRAMDTKLNVVANNIANISTVGFKRSRADFEDILYRTIEAPGAMNGLEQPVPTGKQIGLGVELSGTQVEFAQGNFDQTQEPFHLAIDGDGFFQVQAFIDGQETTVYTRAGNFSKNADGTIVLTNSIGARLEPTITVPQEATQINITERGLVQVRTPGQEELQDVGQILLARFVNPSGLEQLGKNLFRDTPASGVATTGQPTEAGLGSLRQGNLEISNVDPVRELIDLIMTQRAFELNSQSIQSADQSLQTVSNLRR